jgi:hypothetical protein
MDGAAIQVRSNGNSTRHSLPIQSNFREGLSKNKLLISDFYG